MKVNQPAGRRSKLIGYRNDILLARHNGYTLCQICKWLEFNGVSITIKGLSKFIVAQAAQKKESVLPITLPIKTLMTPTESRKSINPLKKLEGVKNASDFNPIPKPIEIVKE